MSRKSAAFDCSSDALGNLIMDTMGALALGMKTDGRATGTASVQTKRGFGEHSDVAKYFCAECIAVRRPCTSLDDRSQMV